MLRRWMTAWAAFKPQRSHFEPRHCSSEVERSFSEPKDSPSELERSPFCPWFPESGWGPDAAATLDDGMGTQAEPGR
ncbi:hypothetical protein BST81_02510 [Leptolyngbya sp. 'hensonii']|uniref:hypothetical protein n=1 Tax=Leptolyngbya sp. 'hensonii' TaxID=1922337 RepID=UPI00094F7F00|nr:hypothetical protein [Leptolyngbya sp. 'hensonii']OLP19967.1 hypothetical protein BST81_02510 [Leptolyngbya sp. 'hensonii']